MKVKQISREEFIGILNQGEQFKLVDVLAKEHFEQEHIKGAISLPVDEIEKNASKLLPDKKEKIIVYCASFDCQASTNGAIKLQKLGYKNVLDYKGGLKDYKETGRSLEGSLHNDEEAKRANYTSCASC